VENRELLFEYIYAQHREESDDRCLSAERKLIDDYSRAAITPVKGSMNARDLMRLGRAFLDCQQLKQSISVLKSAKSMSAHDTLITYFLGQAYWTAGARDRAFQEMLELSASYPDAVTFIIHWARIFKDAGEPTQAIQLLGYAIQSKDRVKRGWAFAELGQVYYGLGKLQEAESSFLSAIALDPNVTGYRILLASTYRREGRHNESINVLRRVTGAPDPHGRAWAMSELCASFSDLGDLGLAIDSCQKAVQTLPQAWYLHLQLARVYAKAGCLGQALHEYDFVLALDPENKYALQEVAQLSHESSRICSSGGDR